MCTTKYPCYTKHYPRLRKVRHEVGYNQQQQGTKHRRLPAHYIRQLATEKVPGK
ncbi:hypothetical protein DPMN_115041 [Dreissena polymorpha]|uniref:Uncharacterized protein n=1 Tax=Dreissena polymorpha TaxID=45954 RepID=A0A9D4QSA4_DREPO|nr:hypothetical protein DPMN_115041 [Dreissena polymorpha]